LLQYIRDQWTHPDRELFDQISDCRDMEASAITPAVMQAMSGLHNDQWPSSASAYRFRRDRRFRVRHRPAIRNVLRGESRGNARVPDD